VYALLDYDEADRRPALAGCSPKWRDRRGASRGLATGQTRSHRAVPGAVLDPRNPDGCRRVRYQPLPSLDQEPTEHRGRYRCTRTRAYVASAKRFLGRPQCRDANTVAFDRWWG
jgi:hypothetical protein